MRCRILLFFLLITSLANAQIRVVPNSSKVSIQVMASDGSIVQSIVKGSLAAGTYSIPLNLNQAGIYTIRLLVNDKVYTSKVIR